MKTITELAEEYRKDGIKKRDRAMEEALEDVTAALVALLQGKYKRLDRIIKEWDDRPSFYAFYDAGVELTKIAEKLKNLQK